MLRDTFHFTSSGNLSREDAQKYHRSCLFEFDLGLDERISDLMR